MGSRIQLDMQYSISPIAHPQNNVLSVEGNFWNCSYLDQVKAFLSELYNQESAIEAELPPPPVFDQSDFTHGKTNS